MVTAIVRQGLQRVNPRPRAVDAKKLLHVVSAEKKVRPILRGEAVAREEEEKHVAGAKAGGRLDDSRLQLRRRSRYRYC